jgi:hypothetical protein
MNKLLLTLLNLLEVGVGITLLFIGVSGTFTYFLFNALIGVMGFLITADGLSRIDDPNRNGNNNGNNPDGGNSNYPRGGHHRTDVHPKDNDYNTPTRPSGGRIESEDDSD